MGERLCQSGGLLVVAFQFFLTDSPAWILDMAWLMILAGLGFALAGRIAGRTEQPEIHEAKSV